jgi:hypothetical protein
MSISSRITAMEEHIGNAYDKLDELGVDLTGVNKNLNNIAELLDGVYEEYPKTTTTNVTEPSIDNTKAGKMEIDLKGNTEQFTTTGKQLCNLVSGTTTKNSYVFTSNNNIINVTSTNNKFAAFGIDNTLREANYGNYVNWSGSTLTAGTYTLSYKYISGSTTTDTISGNSARVIVYARDVGTSGRVETNLGQVYITTSDSSVTFTISENKEINIVVYIYNEGTSINTNINFQVQLEQGSTATSFEPYTGATASPNPDYPQDVRVVTGENTVKVVNKNLFDKNNANIISNYALVDNNSGYWYYENGDSTLYIHCKKNTQYTVSKTTSERLRVATCIDEPRTLPQTYNYISSSDTSKCTITTNANDNYLCVFFKRYSDTLTVQQILDTIQIEEGSTATTYEEHKEQDFPISLSNIELCKIGDYKDYPWKDESTGKWYIKKLIEEGILNGNDNFIFLERTGVNVFLTTKFQPYVIRNSTTKNIISNYFTGISDSQGNVSNSIRANRNGQIFITIPNTNVIATSTDTFKAWLSTHNVEVYYILATPTDIEITDTTLISQLNALEKAKSYDDTTNIIQENNDLPFILDIKTLKKS